VGLFTAVTGVSGSGKSTMVIETLYKAMARRLDNYQGGMGKIKRIVDLGGIERVIIMNQQPRTHPSFQSRDVYRNLFAYSGSLHRPSRIEDQRL